MNLVSCPQCLVLICRSDFLTDTLSHSAHTGILLEGSAIGEAPSFPAMRPLSREELVRGSGEALLCTDRQIHRDRDSILCGDTEEVLAAQNAISLLQLSDWYLSLSLNTGTNDGQGTVWHF